MGGKLRALRWAVETEYDRRIREHAVLSEYKLDRLAKHARSMCDELARRAGMALGLAYAMHDRGARRRLVVAQLREGRALNILANESGARTGPRAGTRSYYV